MGLVYRSKVDIWLLLVLVIVVGCSVAACIFAIQAGGWKMVLTLLFAGGSGIAVPVWALLSTQYTLDPNYLEIKSGPFRWKVPVRSITDIRPTRNPLSSPALSLDRLRIEYHDGTVMISPENKEAFLAKIESFRNALRERR